MFTNYKMAFLNYSVMMLLILLIIMIQNSIWPAFFGVHIPIHLWIPCIIYWGLYRRTGETVCMIYFITLSLASSSSLLTGYLLTFNGLVLLILLLFKRIYYTSWIFFSIGCALTLIFFPLLIWVFTKIIDGHFYFYGLLPELGGAMITWIFSFLLLGLFQRIDYLTITKPKEYKNPGAL